MKNLYLRRSLLLQAFLAFTVLWAFVSLSTLPGSAQSNTRAENAALAAGGAGWVNFQPASKVFGQPAFNTNTSGTALNQLNLAAQLCIDPVTGKIFIADLLNHRVLRYPASAINNSSSFAELVFGTTGTPGTTDSTFRFPTGIEIDSAGRMWVADRNNHRVLRFDNAGTRTTTNADAVLGQPDFITGTSGTTQNKMQNTYSVKIDSAGRLWVADAFNNRVLRFDDAANKPNGANADGVLGQPNFTTSTLAHTQSGMSGPRGLFVDTAGRLWVSDLSNNRVLRFDNAAAKANGDPADGVLGQLDYTTFSFATTQGRMNGPFGVWLDSSNRLYVADNGNRRLLIFNGAPALANGANASNVLGQPNFTSNTANNGGVSGASDNSYAYPVFHEASGTLFVSDQSNNRVLRFFPGVLTAASVSVSGRIFGAEGRFVSKARVSLTDSQGNVRTALVSPFGYYKFEGVSVGETITIQASAKGYTFNPQVINATEDVDDLNFTGQP